MELANKIAQLLDEKKAKNVIIMDISKRSGVADYFVICSASSTTAVKALYEHLDEKLSKEGIEPKGRDIDTKWIAIDYINVIVHIFYDELRSFYDLERLWSDGENIKLIK